MPRSPSPSPRRDRERDRGDRDRDSRHSREPRRRSYSRSRSRSPPRRPYDDDRGRNGYGDRDRDRDYRSSRYDDRGYGGSRSSPSERRYGSPPRRRSPSPSRRQHGSYESRGSSSYSRGPPPPARKRFARPISEEPRSSTRLYIKNLPLSLTNPTLVSHFSQFGAVTEAFILKDSRSGASRGCAFVEFGNEADAARAVRDSHGTALEGQVMDVEFAIPLHSESKYEDRLYIGGLPTTVTEEELRGKFGPYGEILEVVIGRPESGASTVACFVQYAKADDAAKAKLEVNGTVWGINENGEDRQINVNFARRQQRLGCGDRDRDRMRR